VAGSMLNTQEVLVDAYMLHLRPIPHGVSKRIRRNSYYYSPESHPSFYWFAAQGLPFYF